MSSVQVGRYVYLSTKTHRFWSPYREAVNNEGFGATSVARTTDGAVSQPPSQLVITQRSWASTWSVRLTKSTSAGSRKARVGNPMCQMRQSVVCRLFEKGEAVDDKLGPQLSCDNKRQFTPAGSWKREKGNCLFPNRAHHFSTSTRQLASVRSRKGSEQG